MLITTQKRGDKFVLELNGRFDAQGANVVSDAIVNALHQGWRLLELEMSHVDYLSSAGLRVLRIYYEKVKELKGTLHLSELQDRMTTIVEMAGLYSLLAPSREEKIGKDKTPLRSMSYSDWSLEEYELERGAAFVCRPIGHICPELVQGTTSCPVEVLPFPPSTMSLGVGALGNDEAECRERFGVFMAAGGMAACKPARNDCTPDYVAYAEAYIPDLYVVNALSMTGGFSHLVSFACKDSATIGLITLAQHMVTTVEAPLVGFLIKAECEISESESDSDIGIDKSFIVSTCGIVGSRYGKEIQDWFAPWGVGTAMSAHVHAAFFPYQPIRLGYVRSKESIAHLFEQELLDLIHVKPPQDTNDNEFIRFKRGVVWFSKVK